MIRRIDCQFQRPLPHIAFVPHLRFGALLLALSDRGHIDIVRTHNFSTSVKNARATSNALVTSTPTVTRSEFGLVSIACAATAAAKTRTSFGSASDIFTSPPY